MVELNNYQNFRMKSSEDAALLQLYVELERIFYFLAGLNVEFDHVYVFLAMNLYHPWMKSSHSSYMAEEGQWTVMLDNPTSKSSTLAITAPSSVLPI